MKLDHIVVLLGDLSKGLPFYEALLPLVGFSKVRDYVFVNAEKLYLDIRQAPDLSHEYRRHAPGLNHLGFAAQNLGAIVDVQRKMRMAGFDVAEIQSFGEGRALFLKDLDGMRIEVAYDPVDI